MQLAVAKPLGVTSDVGIRTSFFSDRIEKFIPPQKGKKHILHIIRELIDLHPKSRKTDISMVLKYFSNAIKKKCTAFILSDFIDTNDFEQAMLLANKKHDLVALQIYDKREKYGNNSI